MMFVGASLGAQQADEPRPAVEPQATLRLVAYAPRNQSDGQFYSKEVSA